MTVQIHPILAPVGTVVVGTVDSPLGPFGAAISPRGLGRLTFPHEPAGRTQMWARRAAPQATIIGDGPVLSALAEQLHAYFGGSSRTFNVPLDMRGTPFQLRVWAALLDIPYGETRSYRWVAQKLDHPTAVRAVGAANGANPVPIIVPCHRVIGADGTLTGYGGGLDLKERLLALEGIRVPGMGQSPLW